MIGLVIALFAGSFNCLGSVFARKGMHRSGESFSPIPISNFAGLAFFLLPVLVTGEVAQLGLLSWRGVGFLAAAGVLHFVLGRQLAYTGIRLIGATRANPVTASNILVSALLGVLFLGEPLTVYLVLSLLFILGGVILIGGGGGGKKNAVKGSLAAGILAALGAALCWGISPALVKVGLQEISSPVVGNFVSYTAASVMVGLTLFHPTNNEKLRRLERGALIPIVVAGVFTATAHLLRYIALAHSPVSLVIPLIMSINALLVFPLSFLINRKLEVFNARTILGAVTVVIGVLLIFLAA